MNTADFFTPNFISGCLIAMASLLSLPAVMAQPNAKKPNDLIKPPELILNLPDSRLQTDDASWTQPSQHSADSKQIIVGSRRKAPLNLDCGVDVYPTVNPDISLSSRLTGECDFKYRY